MPPAEARQILGDSFIIGSTANSMEDIERLTNKVDYIGLGPFRFTETKSNLSPILGFKGYRTITKQLTHGTLRLTPIIAIGGITLNDIHPLLETGIHGIAVSTAITGAEVVTEATKEFIKLTQLANHQIIESAH